MTEEPLHLKGWLKEFQGESDRACAILGAAFLDAQLERILRSFLVNDRKEVNSLLREGVAGTFGGRTRLCFCLGMLSRDQYKDLRNVAEIRNKFAHELHGLSFASEVLAPLCERLKLPNLLSDPHLILDARERFTMTVALLSMFLSFTQEGVEGQKRVVPVEAPVSGRGVDASEGV